MFVLPVDAVGAGEGAGVGDEAVGMQKRSWTEAAEEAVAVGSITMPFCIVYLGTQWAGCE